VGHRDGTHLVFLEDIARTVTRRACLVAGTHRPLELDSSSSQTRNDFPLQVLRVLVPMAPLLGLLGTVWGMLNVFDAMAARGSADARSMATGVSEAMICTLTGLAVSITGLYPVYYFRRRVRMETEMLADKFTY
jgi:biopolymer transport protein ExbB/TolQ